MFNQRLRYIAGATAVGGISTVALAFQSDERTRKSVIEDSKKQLYTKRILSLSALQQLAQITNRFQGFTAQMTMITKALCEEFHAILLPPDIDVTKDRLLNRLKQYMGSDSESKLKFKKENNGVKIFSMVTGKIPDPDNVTGLNTSRVGKAIIKIPVDEVAAAWWNFDARRDWDSLNTTASQIIDVYGNDSRLVYIKGKPKPMISARDFGFLSVIIPPETVGLQAGKASIFLQVDSSEIVPKDQGSVRGKINSLLVLEAIDASTTECTYICEVEPQGWLPHVAVELAADDLPGTLGVLKKHLESS